jgi:hypothetical protein
MRRGRLVCCGEFPSKTRRLAARRAWSGSNVREMADEGGVKTLIEEARAPHHGLDLTGKANEVRRHLEFAFWVLLEHPRVFEVASHFHWADNATGCSAAGDDLPGARAEMVPQHNSVASVACRRSAPATRLDARSFECWWPCFAKAAQGILRRPENRGYAEWRKTTWHASTMLSTGGSASLPCLP